MSGPHRDPRRMPFYDWDGSRPPGAEIVDPEPFQKIGRPGMKHDREKPRWNLLPFRELEQVVQVLTDGAKKYDDDNWKAVVAGDPGRFVAAALRHLSAYCQGEKSDPDAGTPHLAHAICCLLFLQWMEGEDAEGQNP